MVDFDCPRTVEEASEMWNISIEELLEAEQDRKETEAELNAWLNSMM